MKHIQNGIVYNYDLASDKTYKQPSEEKLARFEGILAGLRAKWLTDPPRRITYEAQAKMIQAGIDLIKKKLKNKQRKLF